MAYVIGIDLGTSNCCVAVVEDGRSHVIADRFGNKVQPSIISFYPDGSHVFGNEAKMQMVYNPVNTIFSTKRLIGRPFDSPEVQQFIQTAPFKVMKGPNSSVMVEAQDQVYSLIEISALILRNMKKIAEEYLGEEVEKAVITVPANFNELQRNATKMAGERAGLNVMRIINEPTAAALAYGFRQELDQKVCVYDFGGGTFDMTVLNIKNEVFEVISTAGDTFLGGDDIDNKIVNLIIGNYKKSYDIDLSNDPIALLRVRHEAEKVKKMLSTEDRAVLKIPSLSYTSKGAIDLNVSLSKDNFNIIIRDLVEKTFKVCDDALNRAGLHASEIDNVILVGGTTHIPLVRDLVQLYFGRTPFWGVNPEEVVALGAAIQGAIIEGEGTTVVNDDGGAGPAAIAASSPLPGSDAILLDVTPLALGVGTASGRVEVLIPRNMPVPSEQAKVFTTAQDAQKLVRIKVYQGDGGMEDDNQLIGELIIDNLPPLSRGEVKIEVTFEIDVNGIVHVSALDLKTNKKREAKLNLIGIG